MEWLGDVPEHWQQKPIWSLFKRIKRTNFPTERLLSVYRDYGVIPKDSRDDNHNRASEDLTPYQLVCANDLVINKMKAWQGSIAISELRGIVSPAYYIYQPKAEYHSKYIHFLIRSAYYIQSYKNYSKGIRVNQWDLENEAFTHIDLLLPSLDEQQKIVSFLDTETSRIDNLIAKQEKLIELLEEQRKSIISHAVTKGLNPNAPMKDSGVEWLGEVPEHWKIGRLKNLLSINNGSDYKEFEVENSENSYPVYGSGGVFTYSSKYIYDQESVLLGRKGTINKPLYVTSPFWAVDTMFYSQVKQGVHGKYVYYQALGFPYDRYSSNTALPSMTQTDLLNLSVVIPIISEQIEITQFLDNENAMFDNLISKQKKLIEKLKEYRASIISHAVTGKIDVREFVA